MRASDFEIGSLRLPPFDFDAFGKSESVFLLISPPASSCVCRLVLYDFYKNIFFLKKKIKWKANK